MKKEIIKYTIKEFLLAYIDLSVAAMEIFSLDKKYRISTSRYHNWRIENKERFGVLIKRLKQRGYITEDKENQEYQTTQKAVRKLKDLYLETVKIPKQEKWDGKFRIVIFDIPEKVKIAREVLRRKLRELDFEKLQGSVYIHPFPCKDEIEWICKNYGLEPYVKCLEAEYVDGANEAIEKFRKSKLLL